MPLSCALETERGQVIEAVSNPGEAINQIIEVIADEAFQCWRFIDPYGETVFNTLQMPQFLKEVAVLKARVTDSDTRRVLGDIERLALRCRNENHKCIRFSGD